MSPPGMSFTDLASIGLTGGITGRRMPAIIPERSRCSAALAAATLTAPRRSLAGMLLGPLGPPPPGRCRADRLVVPLREVRRPRRVAQPSGSVSRGELQERLQRARTVVDPRARVAD